MKKILVLSAGGSAAVNFIRSLRLVKDEQFYIVGTDADKFYIHRSEADKNYLIPRCDHKDYLITLQDIVKDEKIDFIHIQNDREIAIVSKVRELFKNKLFLPSKEIIEICQNKYISYLKWKDVVQQPKKRFINKVNDLRHSLKEFKIVWLREICGAGGKGSLKTDSFIEAKLWIGKHNGWGSFEASEYLSENSITWSSIWKNGDLIVAQGRKRLFWELPANTPSGITGSTGCAITTSDKQLDEIAKKSIFAIDKKPNGIFSVDLTYDKNKIPNATEINIGRFFTTIFFFAQAGLNMPYIYLKTFFNEDIKIDKRYNPLLNNYAWIRGIDFLPKLLAPEEYGKLL